MVLSFAMVLLLDFTRHYDSNMCVKKSKKFNFRKRESKSKEGSSICGTWSERASATVVAGRRFLFFQLQYEIHYRILQLEF